MIEGNPSWEGDIIGNQTVEFKVKVNAIQNGEWKVEANSQYTITEDSWYRDVEIFYVLITDDEILVSSTPFTKSTGTVTGIEQSLEAYEGFNLKVGETKTFSLSKHEITVLYSSNSPKQSLEVTIDGAKDKVEIEITDICYTTTTKCETIVPEDTVRAVSSDIERGSELIANEQIIRLINKHAEELGVEEPHLYITNTYPMSTLDHREFTAGNVYLYDQHGTLKPGHKSLTLAEAISSTNYFKPFLSNLETRQRYVMIRVYCDKEDVKWIRNKVGPVKPQDISIDQTSY